MAGEAGTVGYKSCACHAIFYSAKKIVKLSGQKIRLGEGKRNTLIKGVYRSIAAVGRESTAAIIRDICGELKFWNVYYTVKQLQQLRVGKNGERDFLLNLPLDYDRWWLSLQETLDTYKYYHLYPPLLEPTNAEGCSP